MNKFKILAVTVLATATMSIGAAVPAGAATPNITVGDVACC